jgi:hypothetical protein
MTGPVERYMRWNRAVPRSAISFIRRKSMEERLTWREGNPAWPGISTILAFRLASVILLAVYPTF